MICRVSKTDPCPICKKPDWCGISDDRAIAICMRIESLIPSANGGYVHILKPLTDQARPYQNSVIINSDSPQRDDLDDLQEEFQQEISKHRNRVQMLAENLGLPSEVLDEYEIGWSEDDRAFTFPERNAERQIIGIHIRNLHGDKWAIPGSKRGLFISNKHKHTNRLLICEGLTDTATMTALGFAAIGRSNCVGSGSHVEKWVNTHKSSDIVIVADNDPDCRGMKGAENLAAQLCLHASSVRIIHPPAEIKDAREWLRTGATYISIKKAIEDAPKIQYEII